MKGYPDNGEGRRESAERSVLNFTDKLGLSCMVDPLQQGQEEWSDRGLGRHDEIDHFCGAW